MPDNPNVTARPTPTARLIGAGGWLILFFAFTVLFEIVYAIQAGEALNAGNGPLAVFALTALALNAYGIWLAWTRNSWARIYWILYLFLGFVIAIVARYADLPDLRFGMAHGGTGWLWALYWNYSKRVKATFPRLPGEEKEA